MVERELKKNGKGGSKLITLPQTILELANMENEKKIIVEVEKEKIILKKGK